MIGSLPSAKILVVDDEPDLEALIVQKFRREIRSGLVTFLFAHDGHEALDLLAENRDVDMVVSDINMPRMDGLTLLAKLQESDDRPSTIIVSAYGDMANIRTAMNRGAFDFLTKPIDFTDLETTIERTLRHVGLLREVRQRQSLAERAHASLARYFSPNLAERLAGDASGLELGGVRREVASLFTDIAGFTGLVESLDPAQLAEILNGYFAEMTDLVFAHEGTVAKIVGDAIHVLFGAPGDQPDHAARSVACALALDEAAERFRGRWRERGIEIGATRIGVHAGPAIVGNFGGGRYFDYTAYGDTINTSARLENANKAFCTRICVSQSVVIRAGQFRGRPVGDLVLRGKQNALRAFEPLTEGEYDERTLGRYLDAFAKLEAGEAGAMPAFAALVGLRPDDALAGFHLKRLLNGASGTRIEVR
ncbi:adenylate/guanylate cyclase domain-containing protein [Methylobacterium sp. NEAU K]|uniref:adenylate/guanylate cyclase domain-containing protein n=1 Tax=Methylobacterium sp. NEAU K TaxID=3064946 RepID=UPI0027370ED1|nr:adenylate/guanylate cyclase domain-containing protein [Methylobacterium sp. NEAU K]MDP4006486.1 adenylate/guanylate cyclase domain-containing protein [Methylobacterium sp. NEAU K]